MKNAIFSLQTSSKAEILYCFNQIGLGLSNPDTGKIEGFDDEGDEHFFENEIIALDFFSVSRGLIFWHNCNLVFLVTNCGNTFEIDLNGFTKTEVEWLSRVLSDLGIQHVLQIFD